MCAIRVRRSLKYLMADPRVASNDSSHSDMKKALLVLVCFVVAPTQAFLLGADESNVLLSISSETAVMSSIGATPGNFDGLAYDANAGSFYGVTAGDDSLFGITKSGDVSFIGTVSLNGGIAGLPFDKFSNTLYGVDLPTLTGPV